MPLLNYGLGLALKDSGKLAEARATFEGLIRQYPKSSEASEAVWRLAQTKKDEAMVKVEAARKAMGQAGNKEQARQARTSMDEAMAALREAAEYIRTQLQPLADKPNLTTLRLRMLYEAAWINRTLWEGEIEAAREKAAADALRKLQERTGKTFEIQPYMVQAKAQEIPLSAVPVPPSEKAMREQYQAIIAVGGEDRLGSDARFELGDLLARREEYEAAIKLLAEALEADAPPDLSTRFACGWAGATWPGAMPRPRACSSRPSCKTPKVRWCPLPDTAWANAS